MVKTARKHYSFIEDLDDDILRGVLDFIYVLFGTHTKPNVRTYWFVKRTRAGEACEGRLRRLDEATARFNDFHSWTETLIAGPVLDLYSALD